jgi:hypothetical protein
VSLVCRQDLGYTLTQRCINLTDKPIFAPRKATQHRFGSALRYRVFNSDSAIALLAFCLESKSRSSRFYPRGLVSSEAMGEPLSLVSVRADLPARTGLSSTRKEKLHHAGDCAGHACRTHAKLAAVSALGGVAVWGRKIGNTCGAEMALFHGNLLKKCPLLRRRFSCLCV